MYRFGEWKERRERLDVAKELRPLLAKVCDPNEVYSGLSHDGVIEECCRLCGVPENEWRRLPAAMRRAFSI